MIPGTRSVITVATGKTAYWNMAVNLARSFLVWNDVSVIKFYIITDLLDNLPSDLHQIQVLRYESEVLAKGFSSKLQLDQFSQTSETLFIDADCLCVGRLDSVFDRFQGREVSVIGGKITHGEWFGDISSLLTSFGLPSMPKFNGGIYYLEKCTVTTSVYGKARELEKDYDVLGLVRLRGRPNDELLMALAMAIHGLESLADDGTIMGDLYSCPELRSLDVFRGQASLYNPPAPDRNHRSWYPVVQIHPKVVHFLGDFTSNWQYRAESKKLELHCGLHLPRWLAEFLVFWSFTYWARLQCACKVWFRPWYHRFLGARKVKSSPRV
jgi:hypothetical protein